MHRRKSPETRSVNRKHFTEVYQFKISLNGLDPEIWRRIQVPANYSFWDLHVAIQDAMGWLDYHLHVFRMEDPQLVQVGIPDEDYGEEILPGWEVALSEYFTRENNQAGYEYDFGDSWEHAIVLEEILPRETNSKYPRCLAGERACRPEDCGGIFGYQEFLEAISNPRHEEHESMLTWAGGSFNSESFDPKRVRFEDPKRRLKKAFGD